MTGLELQTKLADVGGPPIVFLTGHGDIPSTVEAMKAGATEFLSKPFEPEELLRAIDTAIHLDRRASREEGRTRRDTEAIFVAYAQRA